MCGIAGMVNWGNHQLLNQMTDVQAHRGPDDRGTWETRLPDGTWIGLSSRRLAILDLSAAGHMPMMTDDEAVIIVYNGEVYNYPQLRQTLAGRGYCFRSNSDTEAILYLYQEYGFDCVHHLNGMFALAIFDCKNQVLFLARDHFGIKPLYYCQDGERFAFASEAKALLQLPDCPRRVNVEALHQYLTFLWVPDPLTMFDGIYKLPAGHYATFRDGQLQLTQYWDLEFPPVDYPFNSSETELGEQLRERFMQSVTGQLLSDVPVGAFLSAGLDSSCIVAMMAQATPEPLHTYTISFPPEYRVGETVLDDTSVAARTGAHFGCEHHEIMVKPDVVTLLPQLIWHIDEPIADPAIITAYLVSKEARSTVKVLLSGVGGDELFAGYRKHVAHGLAQWYQKLPRILRDGVVHPLVSSLPAMRGTHLKGLVRLSQKMVRSGSLSPQDRFIMDSTYFTEELKAHLYTTPLLHQVYEFDAWCRHREYFHHVSEADFLNQMLYLDTKAFMTSLNLTYNDKMSMASSVEVRVPFLDREFVEWSAQHIPPSLKLRKGVTKHILRRAMQPVLPAEVLTQKKAGFGAPVDYWLAHDLREMVDDLLSEACVQKRGYFNPTFVRQLVEEQRSGRKDWSMQLWQLLTFELWLQTFMD